MPQDLWQDPSYYWMWAVGGCLVPMLGLGLYAKPVNEIDSYFKWIYLATFAAAVVALLVASGGRVDAAGDIAETGRARIGDDRLNPISLGHLGATLAVLSLWALVFFHPWKYLLLRIFLISGLACGLYVLLMANSRGPVVVTLVLMVVIGFYAPYRQKLWFFVLSSLALVSIIPIAHYLEDSSNIVVYSRLFGSTLSEHAEQSLRPQLYASAVALILQNPWTGSSLELPGVGYPHNVIIEAFMAVGALFGMLFAVALAMLFWRSISLLAKFPQFSWPAMLFFQHIIGGQFSGSLYSSTYMWASIGLLASVHFGKRNVNVGTVLSGKGNNVNGSVHCSGSVAV